MSLLHWACDRGNLEVVKLLVRRGADINIQDTDKQTPLHYGERIVRCYYYNYCIRYIRG